MRIDSGAHVHLLLMRLCLGLGVGVVIRLKVVDGMLCGFVLELILSMPSWSAVSRLTACLYTSCWNTSSSWTVSTCTPGPRRRLPGRSSVEWCMPLKKLLYNAFALDIAKGLRGGLCVKVGKKELQVSINEADQSACPGNG